MLQTCVESHLLLAEPDTAALPFEKCCYCQMKLGLSPLVKEAVMRAENGACWTCKTAGGAVIKVSDACKLYGQADTDVQGC